MRKMTENNLHSAFAGESQAHMRYLIFADIAEHAGRPNLARLFRAIAFAEQVHATNHLKELKGIGDSSVNLQEAISGETFEVEEMYPAYQAVAKLQEEKGAVRSTTWALEAEKVHAIMYREAKQAIDRNEDAAVGDIYICSVCGYTASGKEVDVCPLCGAKKEKFKKF
ncbi:MAG: rubrerythrin family protein [bacterium]|nr:rubrerythrin family protein [bacterium]